MPPREVTQSTSSSASPFASPSGDDVVADTGRRLGVHHGDDARRRVRGEQPFGVDGLAPRGVDPDDLGAAARRRRRTCAAPNTPLTPMTTASPRLDDVDEARLHAGRAGGRHRERQRVVGAEGGAEPLVGLVEQGEELGVEVAEQRAGERRDDLWVGVAGPGPHQDAVALTQSGGILRPHPQRGAVIGSTRRGCRPRTPGTRRIRTCA